MCISIRILLVNIHHSRGPVFWVFAPELELCFVTRFDIFGFNCGLNHCAISAQCHQFHACLFKGFKAPKADNIFINACTPDIGLD